MLEGLVNLNYAIASLRVNVGCWALEWMLYPKIDIRDGIKKPAQKNPKKTT